MAQSNEIEEDKKQQGCIICDREKISENYCKYHEKAYENVMAAFHDWQEGYGELSFIEYLQKIIENPATGDWAREVAEDLLRKEEAKK